MTIYLHFDFYCLVSSRCPSKDSDVTFCYFKVLRQKVNQSFISFPINGFSSDSNLIDISTFKVFLNIDFFLFGSRLNIYRDNHLGHKVINLQAIISVTDIDFPQFFNKNTP